MSVFQLQEWWGLKVSQEDEEFDLSCFVVGNVDNANPPADKIAIGSQQGVLRIYHPTRPQYRVEDLIFEAVLGAPILQILLGRFIPSNDTLALAVLHPRELVVYEVAPQGGKEGRASFHSIQRLYKHDLGMGGKHFTAYNMCHGSFGGSRNRDMIMVQSLDGKLQIFEQSANAFSRQLADCLIPGPVLYLPKLDAFITTNHACQAECYRYQVLASSQSDIGVKSSDMKGSKPDSSTSLIMPKVRPTLVEWTVNLGETCRQVLLGNFSPTNEQQPPPRPGASPVQSEALLICDKSMFLVKADTGGIIQQRRLDRADASCACVVPCEAGSGNNFLLAGQDGTVQVYAGFNLVWAARLPSVPVHMAVGSFGGLKGLIVTVDDKGQLAVNYLGTKPPVTAVLSHVRDLDYDKIDEEHRGLLQIIRDAQSDNKLDSPDKLLIKSQLPRGLDTELPPDIDQLPKNLVPLATSHLSTHADQYVKLTIRLYLSYSGDRPLSNVSLVVSGPSHVHVTPQSVVLSKVSGLRSTPVVVKIHVYALRGALAVGQQCVVTAQYSSLRGEPRVSAHYINLPLSLCVRPRAPTKAAPCKLVLDTEHSAAPLTELFSDVLAAYTESGMDLAESLGSNAVQAMGFQLFHSPSAQVSILVSKNAGRYRLQAESYPALYLTLVELERRLSTRLTTSPNGNLAVMSPTSKQSAGDAATTFTSSAVTGGEGLLVRFHESLPLDDYFVLVDAHLAARGAVKQLARKLEDAAQQFRMIEKRLLVRFKDRNPTALHGLDLVLKEAYEGLMMTADEMEAQQGRVQQLSRELEAYSKLLAALAAMKYNLPAQERAALQAYLCPGLMDNSEQGWEETVQASLSHALRTTLSSKASKDSVASNLGAMDMPKSSDQLKKTLLSVLEKIERGGRLAGASSTATATAGAGNGPAGTATTTGSTKAR